MSFQRGGAELENPGGMAPAGSANVMRVAVVIPKYGLLGGAEGFAFELTERLACREGLEVHVLANRWRAGSSPVTFHKIPVFHFPRFLRQPSFAYFARLASARGAFHLIHGHDRIFQAHVFSMHGLPHRTWAAQVRKKRLSLFDQAMAWVEKKGLENPLRPLVLPVSTLVRDALLESYDLPAERLRVMHPGVALERFRALAPEVCRSVIRGRHGFSLDDVVAVFVGMNFEVKRLDLVLRAAAALQEKKRCCSPALKILVVGKGNQKAYMGLARDLGVAGSVVFAGPTCEIERYYLASDLFVMPSWFDTFGMAVLEAMAAGLPVVISATVGAADLVRQGQEGFILGKDTGVEEMTEALSLLMDRRLRERMGRCAREAASRRGWDTVAEEMGAVYRAIAAPEKEPWFPCLDGSNGRGV